MGGIAAGSGGVQVLQFLASHPAAIACAVERAAEVINQIRRQGGRYFGPALGPFSPNVGRRGDPQSRNVCRGGNSMPILSLDFSPPVSPLSTYATPITVRPGSSRRLKEDRQLCWIASLAVNITTGADRAVCEDWVDIAGLGGRSLSTPAILPSQAKGGNCRL